MYFLTIFSFNLQEFFVVEKVIVQILRLATVQVHTYILLFEMLPSRPGCLGVSRAVHSCSIRIRNVVNNFINPSKTLRQGNCLLMKFSINSSISSYIYTIFPFLEIDLRKKCKKKISKLINVMLKLVQ
jgi:hypothetical protein